MRAAHLKYHFYVVHSVTVLLFLTHGVVIRTSSLYRQGYKGVPLRPRPPGSPFALWGLLVPSPFDLHQRAGVCLEASLQKLLSECHWGRGNAPSFVSPFQSLGIRP